MMHSLHACVYVCIFKSFMYEAATKRVNNKPSHKMKTAPVKVIIRENILTQINLNGAMLFNIRQLTNDELEPLKTI